jgi:hypothetical protein
VVLSIQAVSQAAPAQGRRPATADRTDQKARDSYWSRGLTAGPGRQLGAHLARLFETPELTLVDASPEWRVFQVSVVVT